MSTTCELLFNSPRPLQDLAALLRQDVGVILNPPVSDGDAWTGTLFGMDLRLFECDYEDDMDVCFSDYAYVVGLTSWEMGLVQGAEMETIALIAYTLYRRAGITGIVVWNTQRLIGNYVDAECDGERSLYDRVTQTWVHPIAQHVLALDEQLR